MYAKIQVFREDGSCVIEFVAAISLAAGATSYSFADAPPALDGGLGVLEKVVFVPHVGLASLGEVGREVHRPGERGVDGV